jgi:hypothetical protein
VIGTMPGPDPPPGPGQNTKPVPGLPDYQSAQLGNTNSLFKIKLAKDRNAANPNGPSMVGHSGRIDIESTDIKSLPQQQVLECAGTGTRGQSTA